jgi:hypothetical protein
MVRANPLHHSEGIGERMMIVWVHKKGCKAIHGQNYVGFEVFTAVTMKKAVIWNVTPCGSCNNRRFGGTQRLHHQVDKNR